MGVLIFLVICVFFIAVGESDRKEREAKLKEANSFEPPNVHGDAGFASDRECKEGGAFKSGGIPMGYADSGKPLFFNGTTSIVSFGASGIGKTNHLIEVALTWPHSMVQLDVTGEVSAVTAHYRQKFGKVYQLNPYGHMAEYLKGIPLAHLNPLDGLNPKDKKTFGARSRKIGEGCIRPSAEKVQYWYSTSLDLAQVVIMWVAEYGEEKTLTEVARIINGDVIGWARRVIGDVKNQATRDALMRFAAPNAEDRKSLGEVIENARTEMSFLLEPCVAECLKFSDVSFGQCKEEVVSLYAISPPELMDPRFLRLMFCLGKNDLLRPGGDVRTLIVADEYYSLRIKDTEEIFATARKYNTQVWACMQDMAQLKALHPQTSETFINNAGCVQWMGASDLAGSSYLSEQCGDSEIYGASKTVAYNTSCNAQVDGQLNVSQSLSQSPRKLILPHEVRQLADDQEILFMSGVKKPILGRRVPYYKTSLRHRARPNPFYKKRGWFS